MNSIESLSIALQEQTELAEALRQQAETLEAERDRLTATVDELQRRAGVRIFADAEKAAAVTVSTPEFIGRLTCAIIAPDSERDAEVSGLIAHIDAHTAAVAAKAEKDGYVSGYAKATVEHNQRAACIPESAAPQQHAQAALSDEQIEALIKSHTKSVPHNDGDGVYYLDFFEKKNFARAILAASQQPAAAPAAPTMGASTAAGFRVADAAAPAAQVQSDDEEAGLRVVKYIEKFDQGLIEKGFTHEQRMTIVALLMSKETCDAALMKGQK